MLSVFPMSLQEQLTHMHTLQTKVNFELHIADSGGRDAGISSICASSAAVLRSSSQVLPFSIPLPPPFALGTLETCYDWSYYAGCVHAPNKKKNEVHKLWITADPTVQ